MTEIMNFKKENPFHELKMIFINLFDFHCTPLMIKLTELNNENTLTKTQYFFWKTIFFNFFLIPIP